MHLLVYDCLRTGRVLDAECAPQAAALGVS